MHPMRAPTPLAPDVSPWPTWPPDVPSQNGPKLPAIYTALHADCRQLGTRLFTISVLDNAADLARRAYTSHPVEYPTAGTKPITRDGWYDHVIGAQQPFVANTPAEFARYFFDHALITSLGLGSCMNIPVVIDKTQTAGTVNLLAEAGHFTPARQSAYEHLVAQSRDALLKEMQPL